MEDNLLLRALEVLKRACKDLQGMAAGGQEEEDHDGGSDLEEQGRRGKRRRLCSSHAGRRDSLQRSALSTLCSLLSRLKEVCFSSGESTSSEAGGGLMVTIGAGLGGLLSALLQTRNRRWQRRRRRRSSRRSKSGEISRVAESIESEIQSWIDRESLGRLVSSLRSIGASPSSLSSKDEEDALTNLLKAFEERLVRGFDRKFQDLVLRSGAFPAVAAVLAVAAVPLRIRERCAAAVSAMVRFNRDVFVGHVLMGGGGAAGDLSSSSSMRVLLFLVAAIKTAIVDEIHADGQIPCLVGFLSSPELDMAEAALELLLKVSYYARKEAVDAMIAANVVKRLVVLQQSPHGGALIEMDDEGSTAAAGGGAPPLRRRPFASCVARLAIQMEVAGDPRCVREAAASEADAATIIAEVLWGASA
ncbi:unnamed protein product [Spirodela intermedia]|uniref:Uncharacterized protein n=1 Tax=Spirodela intermedia TaxID=51605 RepID=A0A7I8JKY6_SPIIN|nr:unnamed protein product [Spirodela intermedia]CAA6670471.1 unnamed protein product [Spirodela intermedia]